MELISTPFEDKLVSSIRRAKRSITIISPYITIAAVNTLITNLPEELTQLRLVTLPPGKEYVVGATEMEAILLMKNIGFNIRMLERLHAKIYCIDDTIFIGSANFTSRGLGLNKVGNREFMVKSLASIENQEKIEDDFWDEAAKVNITPAWLESIKRYIDSLTTDFKSELVDIDSEMKKRFSPRSPYLDLLLHLQEKTVIKTFEHQTKGFLKHVYKINNRFKVKILRSKIGNYNGQKFDQVFNYQIQAKTAELIKAGKIKSILLILEEPDRFICIPGEFLLKKVLLKKYILSNNDWQFKIKREGQKLYMTLKGEGTLKQYEITDYEDGKIRYSLKS